MVQDKATLTMADQ